jgi:Fe2+ transport system protein B
MELLALIGLIFILYFLFKFMKGIGKSLVRFQESFFDHVTLSRPVPNKLDKTQNLSDSVSALKTKPWKPDEIKELQDEIERITSQD